MRAGDLPRSEAEREVADLHNYASGTYRAATRAISRGVSLDATEVYAPRDLIVERGRNTGVELDLANSDLESERDALVERDRDDPLVVIERDSSNDNYRSRRFGR